MVWENVEDRMCESTLNYLIKEGVVLLLSQKFSLESSLLPPPLDDFFFGP